MAICAFDNLWGLHSVAQRLQDMMKGIMKKLTSELAELWVVLVLPVR